MLAVLILAFAPMPFVPPRAKAPAWPVGTREARWAGTDGGMRFLPDGSYLHRMGRETYAGHWERQGDALAVTEWHVRDDGTMGTVKRWWLAWGTVEGEATGDYGTVPLRIAKDARKPERPEGRCPP